MPEGGQNGLRPAGLLPAAIGKRVDQCGDRTIVTHVAQHARVFVGQPAASSYSFFERGDIARQKFPFGSQVRSSRKRPDAAPLTREKRREGFSVGGGHWLAEHQPGEDSLGVAGDRGDRPAWLRLCTRLVRWRLSPPGPVF